MNLKDKNYSPGRKILLAREHGFLPEEFNLIDYRFATASRKMENLADLLRKAGDTTKSNVIKSSQDQLSTILKILGEQKDTFSQTTKENSLLEELWFNLGGDNWKDVINVKDC